MVVERESDGSSRGEVKREKEVSRDGGVICALADERFPSPHTSSAGDSTAGLQSISSAFDGSFSSRQESHDIQYSRELGK